MNGEVFVLDSNFILDYFKDYPMHQTFMREHVDNPLWVSVITEVELFSYHALEEIDIRELGIFFAGVDIAPFDNPRFDARIKDVAIVFRRATRCKLPDAIIAATAICLNATLVTSDQKLLNAKFPNYKARSV